jgi:hypothetical protein
VSMPVRYEMRELIDSEGNFDPEFGRQLGFPDGVKQTWNHANRAWGNLISGVCDAQVASFDGARFKLRRGGSLWANLPEVLRDVPGSKSHGFRRRQTWGGRAQRATATGGGRRGGAGLREPRLQEEADVGGGRAQRATATGGGRRGVFRAQRVRLQEKGWLQEDDAKSR